MLAPTCSGALTDHRLMVGEVCEGGDVEIRGYLLDSVRITRDGDSADMLRGEGGGQYWPNEQRFPRPGFLLRRQFKYKGEQTDHLAESFGEENTCDGVWFGCSFTPLNELSGEPQCP